MRIDAITPRHASNVERIGGASAHGTNASAFRDVLDSVRREHGPASTPTEPMPSSWSSADVDAFAIFAEANRRTESGGVATWSTLRTTAGTSHRASFGVAQLSIREHLGRLAHEPDARLACWGTSRAEIDAMRARGEAVAAFYHLVVDGREATGSAAALELDDTLARRVASLAAAGDSAGLRGLVGARFESTTGLSASALDDLVATRALRDPSMREAFAAQYEHDHGVAFDPANRDGTRMAESARHLGLAHPEVERALTLLGGDDAAATSLGHYLGVGDSAENLLGWHERAASTVMGRERFAALLGSADTTTSHAREVEDFESALASVAGVSDLHGDARVETLARIARIFHGAPTRARESLFVDGRLDSPRCHSRAELDALLDTMRSGRTWSDARLAEHVARVALERSTT